MLGGIDPWGLESLNDIAAMFLGTAVVVLGIGITIGLIRWVTGRASGSPQHARQGLMMVGAGLLGAVVLGSIGGAVHFGSTLGTSSLMPEAARPGTVVIARKAPKTTCTSHAVRNFDDEPRKLTHAERITVVEAVSQGGLKVRAGEQIMTLKWYPTGSNCSADNTTAAPGTEVEVRVYDTVAVGGSDEVVRTHTVG